MGEEAQRHREYLEEFGAVLHHNTDQGEIVAGESCPKFGGGKIIRPIFILIDGRATKRFNEVSIPTDAIAVEATRNYLRTHFKTLNMERDVIMDCRLGTGSTDLRDVFKPHNGRVPRANDTSFGVGHAPFSDVENIVRSVSSYIDEMLRPKYPAIGQDIKIMGLRDGNTITLTVACAIVDRYCADIGQYSEYMELLREQKTVKKGKSAGTVESGKWVGPVTAPVNGAITEVNAALKSTPGLLNSDPYGAGWLSSKSSRTTGMPTQPIWSRAKRALPSIRGFWTRKESTAKANNTVQSAKSQNIDLDCSLGFELSALPS